MTVTAPLHPLIQRAELLAPAGNEAALAAAIAHGADAVYLGGSDFSARRQAGNFAGEQLDQAIEQAHLHGLRVYLALNTLIHDNELDEALSLAGRAAAAGVDAVILQDIGLACRLHTWLPALPLHASTQMTLSDKAGLRLAARLGLSRVILARELTLTEIADLTREAASLGLETEVFVQGALCMSLSGQCLLSSLNGGRSGNRGDCAQPCRLPWRLTDRPADAQARHVKASQDRTIEPTSFCNPFPWLSPCDQSLLTGLDDLLRTGTAALKIEGRMRRPDYVGQVVAIYRQALDQIYTGQMRTAEMEDIDRQRLLVAFNRGGRFTTRALSGHMDRSFLAGPFSGHQGLRIGQVSRIMATSGQVLVQPDEQHGLQPQRNDVLAVRRQDAVDETKTLSAPIGRISVVADGWLIQGFHPAALRRMQTGWPVYLVRSVRAQQMALTVTPSRTKLALKLTQDETAHQIRLTGRLLNGPLAGHQATVQTTAELVDALQKDRVIEQLCKTGGTAFQVSRVEPPPAVPLSIRTLNALRRLMISQLTHDIGTQLRRTLPPQPARAASSRHPEKVCCQHTTHLLSAYFYRLPDHPEQLACGADQYLLPLLSFSEQNARLWTHTIRSAETKTRLLAWIPAARYGRLSHLLPELLVKAQNWGFDGLVASQSSQDLAALLPEVQREHLLPVSLDSTANCCNHAALLHWLQSGARSVSLSPELTTEECLQLLRRATAVLSDGERPVIEVPLYGHLCVMSNAFCPIGFNEAGCRRCVRMTNQADADPGGLYTLTDRRGYAFPLLTHPRVCQTELFQHNNLFDVQDFITLQTQLKVTVDLQGRLYFLDEMQQERRELLDRCRNAINQQQGRGVRT